MISRLGTSTSANARSLSRMGDGSKAVFTPTLPITDGLHFYWDFADLTTLFQDAGGTVPVTADGQSIRLVVDKSGNDYNGVASVGEEPTYKVGTLNQPCAELVGTDQFSSGCTAISAVEMFCVKKQNHDPAISADHNNLWSGASTSHIPFTNGVVYDGFGTTSRKTVGDLVQSLDVAHIYNVVSISGEWTLRVNGSQVFTTDSNGVGLTSNLQLSHGSSRTFDGVCGEWIIYNRKLSEIERSQVTAYLQNKWNIS